MHCTSWMRMAAAAALALGVGACRPPATQTPPPVSPPPVLLPVVGGSGAPTARPATATPVPVAALAPTVAPAPTAAPAPPASPAPGTRPATTLALRLLGDAGAFRKTEFAIDTDGLPANPFNPAEFDLRVRFTSPDGKAVTVPAFWTQDYTTGVDIKVGPPGWRVRFAPTGPGVWTAQAELAQGNVRSAPARFDVAANPAARGFVRVHRNNPRYFQFDNGEFFLPIGLNAAWSSLQGIKAVEDYERWFDQLYRNGGNLVRIWMTPAGFSLEWKDTGLGNYSARLDRAFMLDRVFQLAEQRGIYIMLVLLNHGQFSQTSNPEWDQNPYNAANGGMLARPEAFVTDARARASFAQRVRYIAARWGYSPNLMAWEVWNEVDLTPIQDNALGPWLADVAAQLRAHDPNGHLVTNSYAHRGASTATWRLPDLAIAQSHDYGGGDPVQVFQAELSGIRATAPNKPALIGEHGLPFPPVEPESIVPHDVQFYTGAWSAPFLGYAGTALYWWWDNYFQPRNRWAYFKVLAEFMRGEDLSALAPARPAASPGVTALALAGRNRALVWLRNDAYTAQAAIKALEQAKQAGASPATWQYELAPMKDVFVDVAGLADGAYTAQWYSSQVGGKVLETPVTVSQGRARLTAPEFRNDIAVKLVRAGG